MENSPSFVLHGMKTGNCIRAAIALEEAGLPYVVRHYNPWAPDKGEADYRQLNPTGKVPTLVDHSRPADPFVLTQSNAIVLYAAKKAPDKLLPVGDERAEARALERFAYFVTDVIAPSHAAFLLRAQQHPISAALLAERSMAAIGAAERFASESEFIAGGAFSIADIAAATIISSVVDELQWAKLPALAGWFGQIRARPTFVRGAAAFDE